MEYKSINYPVNDGIAVIDKHVRIIDEQNCQVANEVVGYVQVLDRLESVDEHLATDSDSDDIQSNWIDTGDTGYIKNGVLYLDKDSQDVITANDINYYVHSLERVARTLCAIKHHKLVFRQIKQDLTGKPEVVIFVESDLNSSDFIQLADDLKNVIKVHTGLSIDRVVPVSQIPLGQDGRPDIESSIEAADDQVIRQTKGYSSYEITHLAASKSIAHVTVGVFPARGRYFRKELTRRDGGFYHTTVQVPKGKSFYQLFYNHEYETPVSNLQGLISPADPLKRAPINQLTDIFCPLSFHYDGQAHCSYISEDLLELRVVIMHSDIHEVILINDRLEERVFEQAFKSKNKKYCLLRITREEMSRQFLLKINIKGKDKYFNADQHFTDKPVFDHAFSAPEKLQTQRRGIQSGSIGYQIFPDRFHRSERAVNDPTFLDWSDKPGYWSFYGGDLQGITEKLGYLQGIGVDFIYLNPIFQAISSHRYDVIDYYKIDPILGGLEDFEHLIAEAHAMDIKIILDIPLNHCSTSFFAFQDVLEKQEKSAYCSWFEIQHFPVRVEDNPSYSCWSGYKEYPQFNFRNQQVKDYLIEVARFWIQQFGIDGWRLDSCSDIPYDFVEEFARESRMLKSDMMIIGENWHSDYEMMHHGVDGITNYGLYWDAIIPYMGSKGKLTTMASDLMEHVYKSTPYYEQHSWNFLSNHDIARFQSVVGSENKFLLALTMVISLPGTPVLYYGEEIGLPGLQDPDNRRGMDWEITKDSSVLKYVGELVSVRKTHQHLFTNGTLAIPLVAEADQLLVLSRRLGEQEILIVFNFSPREKTVALPCLAGRQPFILIGEGCMKGSVVEIQPFSSLMVKLS